MVINQKKIGKAYNKLLRPEPLVFEFCLKVANHVQKGLSTLKFVLKWEGLYIIRKVYVNRYYLVSRPSSEGYIDRSIQNGSNYTIVDMHDEVLGLYFSIVVYRIYLYKWK